MRSLGDADLRSDSPQQHCQTTDTALMHRVVSVYSPVPILADPHLLTPDGRKAELT